VDQERKWQREREALYKQWREGKLKAGVAYLRSQGTFKAREEALEKIQKKYGKAFAEDLRTIYWARDRRA